MTPLVVPRPRQRPVEPRSISVLVVDDHRVFAEVLCQRLLELGLVHEATTAETVAEAAALVHALHPDVVFIDHDLAGEPGLDLLPALGSMADRPPVAILSGHSDPRTVVEALESGADGWVVKSGRVEEIIVAADALLSGQTYVSAGVANRLLRLLIDRQAPAHRPSFADGLPPRAYAVLRCLVSGLNRSETAARLYMSPNTVKTHIQKLFRASGTHSTLALVSAARACGVPELDDVAEVSRTGS